MPRIHCEFPLRPGPGLALPAGAARHVQVLRLQPGDALTLFDGQGGEYQARVERMGRSEVVVDVQQHSAIERESPLPVHLALGMPANERMDWLVEKATELGMASLQPLVTERTVLRLSGERALKKQAHWQAIAIAACEQCGRNRVPTVHEPLALPDWLKARTITPGWLLSLAEGSVAPLLRLAQQRASLAGGLTLLSGPEGGLSANEERLALAAGFAPISLGPRVLRAETAPLAVLGLLGLQIQD